MENGHSCLCAGSGVVPPALTGALIDQVMLSLLLAALAALPETGRKAGRTRDLRYKLLLHSQPVENLISSGNNKETPEVQNGMTGESFLVLVLLSSKNLELPAGKAYFFLLE